MRTTRLTRRRSLAVVPLLCGFLVAGAVTATLHLAHGSAQSTLPPGKAARLDALAAQGQRERGGSPPALPTRYPDKPRPVGILDGVPAPLDPHQYAIANMWQQKAGDHYVVVYAGSLVADPAQGVLVVMTAPVDMLNPPTGSWSGPDVYATPGRHGSVRLVAYTGLVLTARAADGTVLHFDAAQRTYS